MKYRKKPVVIEAVQFTINKITREPDFIPDGVHLWPDENGAQPKDMSWGYINTLEGRHHVMANDWIITGVKGEKYPCKPDIFEMTYEKVEDNDDDQLAKQAQENGAKIIEIAHKLGVNELDFLEAVDKLNNLPSLFNSKPEYKIEIGFKVLTTGHAHCSCYENGKQCCICYKLKNK